VIWLLARLGITWDLRKPGAKALSHRLVQPLTGSPLEAMAARTAETPEPVAATGPHDDPAACATDSA
jgi:hypothetical protein